jgi:hypothetical protein
MPRPWFTENSDALLMRNLTRRMRLRQKLCLPPIDRRIIFAEGEAKTEVSMRFRLSYLVAATTGLALLLAGREYVPLAALVALAAYLAALSLIFGKQ